MKISDFRIEQFSYRKPRFDSVSIFSARIGLVFVNSIVIKAISLYKANLAARAPAVGFSGGIDVATSSKMPLHTQALELFNKNMVNPRWPISDCAFSNIGNMWRSVHILSVLGNCKLLT